MPLTLTIRNAPQLENGSPLSLVLDRRGARIGRTPTSDWCLPDPLRYISSSHCEVRFAEEQYELIDQSTNGTFLLGQPSRLPVPYSIKPGDVFVIGRYEIEASFDEASAALAASRNAQPSAHAWGGWQAATAGNEIAPDANPSAWGAPPPAAAISGDGPMSQSWAPPQVSSSQPGAGSVQPPATPSTWDTPAPVPIPASEWSGPAADPGNASADDIWGQFAASNVVDWSRSGFGAAPRAPLPPVDSFATASPPPPAPHPGPSPSAMPAPTQPQTQNQIAELLAAAGIEAAEVNNGHADLATVAGDLLSRLVSGLYVLLEARARAKSQLGAAGTAFSPDGNNPLKFARTSEQALLQLLNPPERGFLSADKAVEDAFKDLQAHQMATLLAMQGALRATLDRFSPSAIRSRAQGKGLMAKILPSARDAALWNAYEKEFGGVIRSSDEAFMDVFAKEFRRAYEEAARR